jgi:hypothetical protein
MGVQLSAHAQERRSIGILETIESLVEIQNTQFERLRTQISANPMILSQIGSETDIQLEPRFAQSLLFSSERKYLDLIRGNECAFFTLIENNLLRTPTGALTHLVVSIKEDQEVQHALVTRENFLETVYRSKCPQNRDLSTIFNNANIASTINNLTFPIPRRRDQCQQIINDFNLNPNTPYFCRVAEALNRGAQARLELTNLNTSAVQQRRELLTLAEQYEFYQQNLSHFHRTYLQNICNNLDSVENFCSVYLADDVWSQVVNGEQPIWKMSYRCREILNNQNPSMDDLRACAYQLNQDPDLCRTRGAQAYQSLYPYFRCDTLSQNLIRGKLLTDYHDCPGRVDNEGITNISRILNHFQERSQTSNPATCASNTFVRFAELNLEYDNKDAWPLSICHEDRVTGGERCHPYVPGVHPDSNLSEDKVVSQILITQNNAPRNTRCQIVDRRDYNPNLLSFQTGCVILYDRDECTTLHCPKRILLDQREVNSFTYKGKATFDYFPNSFRNERFSLSTILREQLRLEPRAIRNLTELTAFFNHTGKGIVHGIGCAEDLLPERFRRRSFNECRPLPFIIDGISTEGVTTNIIIRFPIEDIHSPRSMNWNHIFTAITHYQNLHPIESWMMYGLR